MYSVDYNEISGYQWVEGFELPIPMPSQPPLSEMKNYGLPLEEQIFKRDSLLMNYDSIAKTDQRPFVEQMWHKRLNGEWVIIKGNPLYIPGKAWYFFNFWHTESGSLPEFRMEALEYWWVSNFIERDDTCLGSFIIKCRRLGDTEKTLCDGYEITTRKRKSWFGMQNISEVDAEGNYNRILYAHSKMAPFFKPTNVGTTMPKDELVFDYPVDRVSRAKKRISSVVEPLRSRIDYKSTKFRNYDGKRLRFFHMDEPGKIPPNTMDVEAQWGVVRYCLTLKNDSVIVGKASFTTTVEDMADGATVRVCEGMWDDSNPLERDKNGRTVTGLYRYFRGYKKAAQVDHWGYHKEEEAEEAWNNTIDTLMARGQYDKVSDFKRRYPASIEDSFSVTVGESILNGELIGAQLQYIKSDVERGRVSPLGKKPVRGSFAWSNGFGSKVLWTPDANGKWELLQHPDNPNNIRFDGESFVPKNVAMYAAGIDGIDHGASSHKRGSSGAVVIKRIYDPIVDGHLIYDDQGECLNLREAKTNIYVAIYKDRPNDPQTFYENVAMGLSYFGTKAFIERDKPGVMHYLTQKGMSGFMAYKPQSLGIGQKEKVAGAKTTTELINAYVGLLKSYTYNYHKTIWFVPLLSDFKMFSPETRGKCDLTVAAGYAEILANQYTYVKEKEKTSSRWEAIKW